MLSLAQEFTMLSKYQCQTSEPFLNVQFNTKKAKHWFCSICGVQSFYQPRSHPTSWAITVHCVDKGTIRSMAIEKVDGVNWEQWCAQYIAKQQK